MDNHLVRALNIARDIFHNRLLEHPSAGAARGYLRRRGIQGDLVRKYKLGYAGFKKKGELTRILMQKLSEPSNQRETLHNVDFDQAFESIDFVQLVNGYLERPLSQRRNNYMGLCPFHQERTPSFSVDPNTKLWYCFGCNEGGNIYQFIKKIESLDDRGTFEFIRNTLGISIGESFQRSESNTQPLSREEIEKILVRASLSRMNGSRLDDYFFDERLMFPILDQTGSKTLGFAGRQLPGGREPKYVNSKTSSIYKKDEILYGLHTARRLIDKQDRVFLCEGYFDVMALQKINLPCVALGGTAITTKHISKLTELTRNFVLCFDSDSAGRSTTRKLKDWIDIQGLNVEVLVLPEPMDPADYLGNSSEDSGLVWWGDLAELKEFSETQISLETHEYEAGMVTYSRWYLDDIITKNNLGIPENRIRTLENCNQFVSTINPLIQSDYRDYVYRKLNFRDEGLIDFADRSLEDSDREPLERSELSPENNELTDDEYPDRVSGLLEHPPKVFNSLLDRHPDTMSQYPRTYVAWTSDEENLLRQYSQEGMSVAEISRRLGRSPGGIRSKLRKLGLS